MTKVTIPIPNDPVVDEQGRVTRSWRQFFNQLTGTVNTTATVAEFTVGSGGLSPVAGLPIDFTRENLPVLSAQADDFPGYIPMRSPEILPVTFPDDASGILDVPHGGTGRSTNTIYSVILGNDASLVGLSNVGTNGQIFTAKTADFPYFVSMSGDATFSVAGAITIANDAVTFAKMQNIATDSLIGRDTAGTGDPENILLNATLSMDGAGNLQRAALTGDVTAAAGSNTTAIANNAVTDSALRDSAALSVIGRSANSSGDPADIAAGTDGHILRRSGTSLGFGKILTNFITGTATNDNATAGDIGETGSATGSGVALTTATTTDICSVSLAAGDYLSWGTVSFTGAAGTLMTQILCSLVTTTATNGTSGTNRRTTQTLAFPAAATSDLQVGPSRFSLSGTTTVYLTAQSTFTVSTCSASGEIVWIRIR